MALYSLHCAGVPLRNCTLTVPFLRFIMRFFCVVHRGPRRTCILANCFSLHTEISRVNKSRVATNINLFLYVVYS